MPTRQKLSFYIIFLIAIINIAFASKSIKQLDNRIQETNSLVCVGLDPDLSKMPITYNKLNENIEKNVLNFLLDVVDITSPHACSFKIQKAFFDQLDQGHIILRDLCNYIHNNYPSTPIFIDCKIGDIDNTMQAYMNLIFKDLQAEGVVINPYMGDDVFDPFLSDSNKAAIVLIQTSNPNARIIQEIKLKNDNFLWEEILDLTISRWNKNKNIIVVLSSNSTSNYELIRKKIPQDMPILLAGIGSQGGNPIIMKQLLNDNKRGVFVNSSRGILYPFNPSDDNWKDKILNAVIDLKNMLNNIREEG